MSNNGIAGVISGMFGPMRVIVDMVILSLYLGLPFFFMSMLGWAGERQVSTANDASGKMGSGAKDVGGAGGGAAKKAAGS